MAIEQLMEAVLKASPAKRRELEAVICESDGANKSADKDELKLITPSDTAKILGVGRSTVYSLIKTGRLDTVELNGIQRVTMRSIREFANGERPSASKKSGRA